MAVDYNSVIQNATNAYNTTVAGYKSQLAQQQAQQQGIVQGYNALQATALGGLEQQSAVAGKLLSDQYKQQGAQQQMQLFRQGLGNSTTRNNLQNQLNQSSALAQTDRLGKFAGMAADKTTQIGLAGLGYAGGALRDNMQFAGQGLQYAGQGSLGVANLAQGFAGMENQARMQEAALANQKALQDAQFAQQIKMQRLNQLYGAGGGGGGGHVGSYDHPGGQGGAARDNPSPWFNQSNPYMAKNIAVPEMGSVIGANGEGYAGGMQPWNGEDLTGYSLNGQTINNDQVAWGEGDWSPYGYQGEDLAA